MFERIFGITKQAFFAHHVVPANDNDRFNDNKCSFCWDSYHEDHPAVRALTCNHVFGRDCLVAMTNGPNGDKCPLCRCQFFTPSLPVMLGRLIVSGLVFLEIWLQMYTIYLMDIWVRIPGCLQVVISFIYYRTNPYFYADLLIRHGTGLQQRNPHLQLLHARTAHVIYETIYICIQNSRSVHLPPWWIFSAGLIVVMHLMGGHGRIDTKRDNFLVVGVMIIAILACQFVGQVLEGVSMHSPPDDVKILDDSVQSIVLGVI